MSYTQLLEDLGNLFLQFKESLIANIPKLIFALCVILIGILIARILQVVVKRSLTRLDRFLISSKLGTGLQDLQLERSASLMGKIVFWIIIVLFLTAATEVLGLPIFTTWMGGLVKYLPNILIAAIVIFLGIFLGRPLRDIIITASAKAGITYGNMLGKFAQYGILFLYKKLGKNTCLKMEVKDESCGYLQ